MGRGQELLNAAREGDKRTVEKILGQITNISGPFTSFKNILQVGKSRAVELDIGANKQDSKLEKPEDPNGLRRGAGVNVQDDNGYTPLHQACLNGHRDIVRVLLSVGASPCMVDKKGATPLHLAAFNGDTDVCWMLLAHNNPPCNIDQLTSDHETALLIAAQFGFVNVVAQLVTRGADVTIKNNNDESALDLAAQYGRLAVVQHLLQVRPHLVDQYRYPACRNVVFTSTPLHRASKNGRKDVVTALIDAGMDPNVRTHSGTPLHEAARFGKPSVVRILLNKGADLHAQDSSRKTVYDLLAEYPEEATRKVRKVIREYENIMGNFDSDKELPPFPVQDYSPDAVMKTTETQKHTNNNESFLSPSSSSLTKNHPQSFVKKLASKCLGLKAKFNSAPNISNSEAEVDVKSKQSDQKSNSNTMLIGNSKFFKMLSKKEESGEIVCNDEFDTISLDRLGTLNRDSVVNRSNRSCPGFKTSLPNISENNELSDSQESIPESVVITEIDCNKSNKDIYINEAVNRSMKLNIFEPREIKDRRSVTSVVSTESTNSVNECYEPYEFTKFDTGGSKKLSLPKPPPRTTIPANANSNENIYENVVLEIKTIPKPAARIHIPVKPLDEVQKRTLYENIAVIQEKKQPEPVKRTFVPNNLSSDSFDEKLSIGSRSSTLSSDSMIDETNLEDILLSEKSKSFRHGKNTAFSASKTTISRTHSNSSDSSDMTEASALENVDCSGDAEEKPLYLSMTGTMPNKKADNFGKKKVLFRHKTFTNIEVDRNSVKVKDLPQWNNAFLKETLAHYHIRGTGHCIYKAPTVKEFIYIFNRDTLYSDVPPFTKVPNDKRDSYYETAICFCRPRPRKFHSSAEDLLDKSVHAEDGKVTIDIESLINRSEMTTTSFQCYCDSGTCTLHSSRRDSPIDLVVKFSAIKRSISTPDITLDTSPYSTASKSNIPKNKSVPSHLEDPYAVVTLDDIIARNSHLSANKPDLDSPIYTPMSHPSTLSSSSSARPYSIKDISEVISLNAHSISTASTLSHASGVHLPIRKSSSSEYSGHWSLHTCNSNTTIKSDASFKSCQDSSDDSDDGTLHSDEEVSDAETVKSEVSTAKRPWVHSDSFRFGSRSKPEIDVIVEENSEDKSEVSSSKHESGICLEGSESSSSECEDDSGIPRVDADMSLDCASLERVSGLVGGVRSGSGRRRWDEAEGTSEGDALSVSSAASSCAPLLLAHHHEYSKVSGAKHYLKHGRSVDQYVDGKLSYSEYEENHNSPRVAPVPNPRPSLKHRSQPVAITAMYENIVIKEQNPRRKLRRNNFTPNENYEQRMNDNRVRKYSNQEKSSLESLLDDQSMNSPSDCERYYEGKRASIPLSPTHYEQPPTPDHPPPSAKQAENCIHERIRPLSQLIMEVVEEIRIRKKSQGDLVNS